MSILDKLKKRKAETVETVTDTMDGAEEQPEKLKSYLVGIPLTEADVLDPEAVLARLREAPDINLRTGFLEDGKIVLQADCLGDVWTMEVWVEDFKLPAFYRVQHFFPDMDAEALKLANLALVTAMDFDADPLRSYHAQLKLLDIMLPDKLAVLDDSAEKLLSPMWVSLAAASEIDPSPNYLFTVQAVGGGEEDGEVWLHTHGLNRCGLPELEIINSNAAHYQDHYQVIANTASRLLDGTKPPMHGEGLYIGRLPEDNVLVITLLPWREAVARYADDQLGGKADRKENHNGNTCGIYVYPTEKDYQQGCCQEVSVFDAILADNPMYWLSDRETDRMKALAIERLSYMKRAFHAGDCKILIKVGLEIDEEYRSDQNSKEHIWFELLELDAEDKGFTAKLTQEPYYISALHEGDEGHYCDEEITDWIIFTPEYRISPDDVYLMEEMPKGHNDTMN